ncbi:MAG: phosphopyruvate hydratase [Candidatus Heimdallarchaeota archaeon]|nr:MAG: phosphopyruvate hydratase [Candidatus Heimdallarchaeota archaeon]
MKIKKIHAREIFDSRGNPTVEVECLLDDGTLTRAMVPSGASTGIHEALELRDGGTRLMGKSVSRAVANVKSIGTKLEGLNPRNQTEIDNLLLELDGTENKSKLGANAILGVSMAVCKAGAISQGIPLYEHLGKLQGNEQFVLPVPSLNVINGGEHGGNDIAFQEFMILPVDAPNFKEAMVMGVEVYHTLKKIIKKKHGDTAVNVGDEGGFAPPLSLVEEPLKLIMEAIDEAGHTGRFELALDPAASEFYENGKYMVDGKALGADDFIEVYEGFIEKYPIVSIEDAFDQDDWETFQKFTQRNGDRIQIVGDDLLVTNVKRIQEAIDKNACNSLLLKVNQIGSVTESINAAKLSQDNGWTVMVSHRSGETEDPFIADLVVGLKTGQIKTGAPCRSERLAKYNQLIRIEEQLGEEATYAGKKFRQL